MTIIDKFKLYIRQIKLLRVQEILLYEANVQVKSKDRNKAELLLTIVKTIKLYYENLNQKK